MFLGNVHGLYKVPTELFEIKRVLEYLEVGFGTDIGDDKSAKTKRRDVKKNKVVTVFHIVSETKGNRMKIITQATYHTPTRFWTVYRAMGVTKKKDKRAYQCLNNDVKRCAEILLEEFNACIGSTLRVREANSQYEKEPHRDRAVEFTRRYVLNACCHVFFMHQDELKRPYDMLRQTVSFNRCEHGQTILAANRTRTPCIEDRISNIYSSLYRSLFCEFMCYALLCICRAHFHNSIIQHSLNDTIYDSGLSPSKRLFILLNNYDALSF